MLTGDLIGELTSLVEMTEGEQPAHPPTDEHQRGCSLGWCRDAYDNRRLYGKHDSGPVSEPVGAREGCASVPSLSGELYLGLVGATPSLPHLCPDCQSPLVEGLKCMVCLRRNA